MARAALEMGMWALAAERAGLPLAVLLGGTRERVAAGISLGIQRSPTELVERARAARAQGYAKVKLKIALNSAARNFDDITAILGRSGFVEEARLKDEYDVAGQEADVVR